MHVVLGVAGGIAAYKAASLLRLFTESGDDVRVVPTRSALEFVGAATWAALSGHPVHTEVFDDVHEVPHVRLGREADLVVVAPATADLLARAAAGRADDLLTATLLTASCPVLVAPAMHTEMWRHPATRANVATLRDRGVVVLDPDEGRLTGADSGPGRLPEPAAVHDVAVRLAARSASGRRITRDLAGRHVLVTAGGTREPLDPVRYLGNRSSGRQGVAVAAAAATRGADVTLVGANLEVPPPGGVTYVPVSTTAELEAAALSEQPAVDVVVMAAAVADFRPAAVASAKIKKTDDGGAPDLALVRNPDVLRALVDRRAAGVAPAGQCIVGFAAETGDDTHSVLDYARAKLARKGCDLLVVNEVGERRGFGTRTNTVTVLSVADGTVGRAEDAPKPVVGDLVLDAVLAHWAAPARVVADAAGTTGSLPRSM